MIKSILTSLIITMIVSSTFAASTLKLAVAGLSHGHVDWIFNRKDKHDVELVGIYESNTVLIDRYAKQYGIDKAMFFTDLEKMLDQIKPDAVSAFGAVSEHLSVVRACALRKIHVMVEKPLASSLEDAIEIEKLANKHQIHVLTNFETSWYESNQQVQRMLVSGQLGDIRKVMVNDGHSGPKEIGVSKDFFQILTDPEKNGAGALIDFGCYGANLMTWLMAGEKPLSVTAVTHQNKPDIYKQVDDEATIILQYSGVQCVIQASWNWPFSRKDMEVFCTKGYAVAADATTLRYRLQNQESVHTEKLTQRQAPFDDPFSVLAAVVKGKIILNQFDCYGLPINVITVAILDAALKSAAEHKTIYLSQ